MRERPWLLGAVLAATLAAAASTAAVTRHGAAPEKHPGRFRTTAARHHPPKRRAPRSLEIAAVGDMTFGRADVLPAGGASRLLAHLRWALHSDVTVGNLETTLGSGGYSKCPRVHSKTCFAFQAPAGTAGELRRAGFAAVNVANNHSDDYGDEGIRETGAALRSAGLAFTGRPGQITYVVRNGVKVALLGFAPYRYDQDLLDVNGAKQLVRRAAERSDIVIVFIHAGAEGAAYQHVRPGMETYLGELRGDPLRFAHAVVDAGADVVLGSGPHVLRGMEWYRGRLIAFSLGNFVGYHTLDTSGVLGASAVLRLRLDEDGSFVAGSLVPLRLDASGTPSRDASGDSIGLVSSLSRADFAQAGVRLSRAGVLLAQRPSSPGRQKSISLSCGLPLSGCSSSAGRHSPSS